MTRFVAPENVDTLLTTATAELQESSRKDGRCECVYDKGRVGSFCWPHRVLGLLVPTVEAAEVPF